jgi:hypothetical protein
VHSFSKATAQLPRPRRILSGLAGFLPDQALADSDEQFGDTAAVLKALTLS